MGDAALSNGEEAIVVKTPLVDESDRHESSVNRPTSTDLENFIPTAIVKPKYQKLSFDERQLPVCGSTADNASQSPALTTITTTPRKVQKHLPKSQKSFAKQTRKLVTKAGELCVDYDVSDKEAAINTLRHREKDIDCCFVQNSVAIVQPLKKIIDVSLNMDDEKNQKPIDSSKNSFVTSHKHELKSRNSSKIMIATNEVASRMSECGNNNLNSATRRVVSVARDCEKKVPTKKKDHKDISGN